MRSLSEAVSLWPLALAVVVDGQGALDWAPLAISLAAFVLSAAALGLPYLRRPNLSLRADAERTHSRVEADRRVYVRLPVRNKKRRRSAKNARVVLDGYRRTGSNDPLMRLGSPFLAWPSTFGQDTDSHVAVIFSDVERPVAFGRFTRAKVDSEGRLVRDEPDGQMLPSGAPMKGDVYRFREDDPTATWRLLLSLAAGAQLNDERDWLLPGAWTVRLIVGADDGDAHAYEVEIAWKGDEPDSDALLRAVLGSLKVRRA